MLLPVLIHFILTTTHEGSMVNTSALEEESEVQKDEEYALEARGLAGSQPRLVVLRISISSLSSCQGVLFCFK